MSAFERILSGLKSIVVVEAELKRIGEELKSLDARERETRERLVYLEGVIAGARARAGRRQLPKA